MARLPSTTTFRRRGTLAGIAREHPPAGTGQNRATRAERPAPQPPIDEALYYRARLILGEDLPRPDR